MKILISSRSFGKIDNEAIDYLKKHDLDVVMNPYGKKLDEDELYSLVEDDVVGIIAGTETVSKKILLKNPNLKVISRYGIGIDNVDVKTAREHDILIFNTPDAPSLAVAELTLTLILDLLKKIFIVDKKLKQNNWKPEIGHLLSGKAIGIIGLGRIGKKLVQFLQPFNVNILVYDIQPDLDFIERYNLDSVDLKTLLEDSDVISLHLPLYEKTKYLIDENELDLIKKSAVLINTARGGLINENVLYEYLKNHRISGAAIDVFENEPDVGRLKELENIILTPHIATYTVETRKQMEREAAENLVKGLKKVHIL